MRTILACTQVKWSIIGSDKQGMPVYEGKRHGVPVAVTRMSLASKSAVHERMEQYCKMTEVHLLTLFSVCTGMPAGTYVTFTFDSNGTV